IDTYDASRTGAERSDGTLQPRSGAPVATLLPDHFVFIGTRAGEEPAVVVGAPVPVRLLTGPDPDAPDDQQLRPDAAGGLVVPTDLRWIADFDRAVEVGMGLRVPLSEAAARAGFDRVLVLGVRTGGDGAGGLAELLRHHALGRKGLSVV